MLNDRIIAGSPLGTFPGRGDVSLELTGRADLQGTTMYLIQMKRPYPQNDQRSSPAPKRWGYRSHTMVHYKDNTGPSQHYTWHRSDSNNNASISGLDGSPRPASSAGSTPRPQAHGHLPSLRPSVQVL